MIVGIGCDVINIERIEFLWRKFSDRFPQKILGIEEQRIFYELAISKQVPFLAKRFAAKEAVSKAFQTGIGNGFNFKDIQILNNYLGAPYVVLSHYLNFDKNIKIHISLADEVSTALAFAVISY